MSIKFILSWQLMVYFILFLSSEIIAGIFSDDPEVIKSIQLFIWVMPLGYGLQGIIILTNSSLNAMHKPLSALYLSIARFFVFYVPLAYLGSVYFGLYGFFCGAVCGNLLMGIISYRTFNEAIASEMQLGESTA